MPLHSYGVRAISRGRKPDAGSHTSSPVLSNADLAGTAAALKDSLTAAGVAIALESDGAIVCRAAAGDAAPEVGTHVARGGGITGECISTGLEVGCSDTDLDPRVNAAVCRQLGIRSLVCVPLHWNGKVVGVAVAMFTDPGAFDVAAVQSLKTAAQQIVSRVYGDFAGADLNPAEEESSFAAAAVGAKAPRVSLANNHPIRNTGVGVGVATAQVPTRNPVQTEVRDQALASLRASTDDLAAPAQPDNVPSFVLLNSGLSSFDGLAEFLSRRYSVMLAVVVMVCLLLTFIGMALKPHAVRPADNGRFGDSGSNVVEQTR